MNYKFIMRAFGMDKAIEVYLHIYECCQIEDYASFNSIREKFHISEYKLRLITNRMSRIGLIKSVRDTRYEDKRKRYYVVKDAHFAEKFCDFLNPNS